MGAGEEAAGAGKWRVELTPTAARMLEEITDRRVRGKLADAIDSLAEDPQLKGKPLLGPLAGYRSLRAVGQRYRIVYKVEQSKVVVYVVAVGLRREGDRADLYRRLARELVRLAILEDEEEQI